MKQRWTEQELVAHWVLTEAEKPLLKQRTERSRLGLAVMLKFFQLEGRFPRYHKEVPLLALDFVAEQLAIPVAAWFAYPLTGRSGKRDREQLRDFLGFRPATTAALDEPGVDLDLKGALSPFSHLKADPGRVGLASVLKEIAKLKRIDDVQLPMNLFTGVTPKTLERYRLRVATESVQELRRHPEPIRYPLLAAFCWQRRKAIIDGLIELLMQIVHRISVRAERKVVAEIIGDLEKVHGKTMVLYRLAEAALRQPEGIIRDVLFPLVGEETLQALVKEYHAKGPAYRRHVHTLLRSSYSHHYRRMLPLILDALTFRSNNAAHQPVIQALVWLKAHRHDHPQFIACDEIPIDGVVRPQLQAILLEAAPNGTDRINRINYEICVLQALRERLRCKEIWVEGADRFRNPDDDLPADFATQRSAYYQALNQPQSADRFVETLQQAMQQALSQLDANLPNNDKVKLKPYGQKRIIVTPFDPQPEPTQLLHLKAEINRRWPMTSLLDVLKETDLRVGFTEAFKSLGTREVLERHTVQQRLLLCLYGLGTNAGLKRMLSSHSAPTYRELLYIRHRFIEKNALREAIRRVVNATFAARFTSIWGEGTTACASDAKKFGAWDQNLMTEWHIRYGGRGVMIYWHVEKKAACIYSQLKRCSSSEVAAMIEGVLRHCTEMAIEQHYVDSHGHTVKWTLGPVTTAVTVRDLRSRLKRSAHGGSPIALGSRRSSRRAHRYIRSTHPRRLRVSAPSGSTRLFTQYPHRVCPGPATLLAVPVSA